MLHSFNQFISVNTQEGYHYSASSAHQPSPSPLSCPVFLLVTPVTNPSAMGQKHLMQSCSPSAAFQQEVSHTHVPHGHQHTWFAPQLQQSVSHTSLVLLCMSSRQRTWEKTWCVWKHMTDRNAEKLPATKTSAVMTAVLSVCLLGEDGSVPWLLRALSLPHSPTFMAWVQWPAQHGGSAWVTPSIFRSHGSMCK